MAKLLAMMAALPIPPERLSKALSEGFYWLALACL
jgi:hypothetical protein